MKMGKHSWLMMAGCVVMFVGMFILPLLGVRLAGVLPILLALACPLSMVFMMGAMGRGHDHSDHIPASQDDKHSGERHGDSAPRALPVSFNKEQDCHLSHPE